MLSHSVDIIVACLPLIGYLPVLWPIGQVWWLLWQHLSGPPASTGRSREPIPGETEAPPCPACAAEQAAGASVSRPPEPPPRIEQTRGRPREVDTSHHYCPNEACDYYGWVDRGNIRANGHPNGGAWRQLECVVCGKCFMETHGTLFYGRCLAPQTIWRVLKALAEGLGIQGTARVFDLDPNTVEGLLADAAQHLTAVSRYLIHELHLSQVQVDEMWALLGRRDVDPETQQKSRGVRWVWAAIDPVSKLLLATIIGDRSETSAQRLIHAVVALLAPGCVPLFLSDQWSPYAKALLTHFGHWVEVPRRFKRGRPPKPRWRPLPGLQYAQVVKQRIKGRVVGVTQRVVYGDLETVQAMLTQSGVGAVINTAFIERVNLGLRQLIAPLARKVITLAKTERGLDSRLALGQAYYNFCLPHHALRQPLPEPQPTKGTGSPKKWHSRTPAMAAGVTDHIWKMEELLLFRVPPWQQPTQTAA